MDISVSGCSIGHWAIAAANRSAFLTGPASGDPLDIALTYLAQTAAEWGVDSADIADLLITDHYTSQHNGVTYLCPPTG